MCLFPRSIFEVSFHVQVTISYAFVDLGLITWSSLVHLSVLGIFHSFHLRMLIYSILIMFLKVTVIFY